MTLIFLAIMASSCIHVNHTRQSCYILFEGATFKISQGSSADVGELRELSGKVKAGKPSGTIAIDYPFNGSIFPPEIVAPTFLWNDPSPGAEKWVLAVGFDSSDARMYVLTSGNPSVPLLDSECIRPNNRWEEPLHQAWTPDSGL